MGQPFTHGCAQLKVEDDVVEPIEEPISEETESPDSPISPTALRARNVGTLFFAVAENKEERVLRILNQGVSVNMRDYDQRTALHIATAESNPRMVNLLLEKKADVQAKDRWGQTPLDEAIRCGDHAMQSTLRQVGGSQGDILETQNLESRQRPGRDCKVNLREISFALDAQPQNIDIQVSRTSTFLRQVSRDQQWFISPEEVELGEKIGSTLKSEVYRATWRTTKVVLKKLLKQPNQDMREEMLHEIKLLSTMRHPDLVMFLGACLEPEQTFFITEYMAGGDLYQYYDRQYKNGHPYRPPWATFIKWSTAVARALTFLHERPQPVVHRDLKPMNLLLNSSQDLKVCDFGISKIMAPRKHNPHSIDSNPAPVMSGGVGTWRYMAPEIVRYEQYTERIDIYSFALIMWFMFTGSEPFLAEFGKDAELILKAYLRGEQPRPQVNNKFKPGLGQLIKDCWKEAASARPSAFEASERLAQLSKAKMSTWELITSQMTGR